MPHPGTVKEISHKQTLTQRSNQMIKIVLKGLGEEKRKFLLDNHSIIINRRKKDLET